MLPAVLVFSIQPNLQKVTLKSNAKSSAPVLFTEKGAIVYEIAKKLTPYVKNGQDLYKLITAKGSQILIIALNIGGGEALRIINAR